MTDNYVYFAVDCVLYKGDYPTQISQTATDSQCTVYSNSLLASFNSRLSIEYKNGVRNADGEQQGAYDPAIFTTLDSPALTWTGTGTGDAMLSQPHHRSQ